MNTRITKDFKRILEAKQTVLLSNSRRAESIVAERVPDLADEFLLEVERGMAADALDRRTTLLHQVAEALERIVEGKYGLCLECKEEISPKRLEALPWAALCLACQQAEETGLGASARPSADAWLGSRAKGPGHPLGIIARDNGGGLRRPMIANASASQGAAESEVRI